MNRDPIKLANVMYIKLGPNGALAKEALESDGGVLPVLFSEVPAQLLAQRDWTAIRTLYLHLGKTQRVASRLQGELQIFVEEPRDTLWITFVGDDLYWCYAAPEIEPRSDGGRQRRVIGSWSREDIHGVRISKNNLHGEARAVQGYRGTICRVKAARHVINKINGAKSSELIAAEAASEALAASMIPIIRSLHEHDFEVFVDHLFRLGGWWPEGESGGTVEHVDLQLVSPLTGERLVVQIKSKATDETYRSVAEGLASYTSCRRILASHSPVGGWVAAALDAPRGDLELWDHHRLASQAVRMGLVDWLMARAA